MRPVKPVTVKLDRERRFAFDFNAIAFLDEAGGINVMAGGLRMEEFARPSKMLVLLTACLQTDAIKAGEKLTVADVGELLTPDRMEEFAAALEQVLATSIPDEKAATANPPAAAEPCPDSSSGPSAATTSDSPTTSSAS